MATARIVGTPLPGETLPYYELLRAGPGIGGKIHGWVLSPFVVGVSTHYLDRRTVPCTKHLGKCEGCDVWKRRTEWAGYIGVLDHARRKPCLYEITIGAANACPELNAAGESLRGKYMSVWRKGESAQGMVRCSFEEKPFPRQLPPPPRIVAGLARMWHFEPAFLGRVLGIEEGGAA